MSDPKLADFFQRHGGQRLSVVDNQPIERGMSDTQLCEVAASYQEMLDTGVRANGQPLTVREKSDIGTQLSRVIAEMARRERGARQ